MKKNNLKYYQQFLDTPQTEKRNYPDEYILTVKERLDWLKKQTN